VGRDLAGAVVIRMFWRGQMGAGEEGGLVRSPFLLREDVHGDIHRASLFKEALLGLIFYSYVLRSCRFKLQNDEAYTMSRTCTGE